MECAGIRGAKLTPGTQARVQELLAAIVSLQGEAVRDHFNLIQAGTDQVADAGGGKAPTQTKRERGEVDPDPESMGGDGEDVEAPEAKELRSAKAKAAPGSVRGS